MDNRLAIGPAEAKQMDTQALRKAFLIDKIFEADKVLLTLTHYDRYIAGGSNAGGAKSNADQPG